MLEVDKKIAECRKQLNAPTISPCRKRDLTKYLWRLRAEKRAILEAKGIRR